MGDLAFVERRFNDLLCLGTLDAMPPPPSLRPPDSAEFAHFFAGYVARVAGVADPIDELTAQRVRVLTLFSRVSEERSAFRYAAGKWTIKQLLGHLGDSERILGYRMLRIGRGDTTPLAGWDENDYAGTAAFDSRSLADLTDDWNAARDSTIALARGLPDQAWDRTGTANESRVSARALLYIILGHVEHHCAVLKERYGI
jgi:hypothetical protein